MVDLVLGIAAAVGASTLYSLGIAFQAMDARDSPHEEHLRLALAFRLVKRARWLLGTGLSILGWPLQVVALLLAPLVVVQPALAVGLLALMFLAERMLGERAGRYEYAAMGAILTGVVGAGLCAPPHSVTHTSQQLTITLALLVLGAAALLPYALRLIGRPRPELTMICAGLAFGWSGVATKLASDDLSGGHLLVAAAWGVSTALASGVGVLSEMSSLQSRPAIQVAPVVFVTQTVVPVVLAPTLLEEHFTDSPLGGIPLAASLLLLLAGAALLARSPLLLALMDPQRTSDSSGSVASPSDESRETIRSSPATDAAEPSTSTTSTSPARIGR
jgi:FtsH-binding integral membrane protein